LWVLYWVAKRVGWSVAVSDYWMVCFVVDRMACWWDEKRADSTALQMAVEWDQKTVEH
jgi:hypothetical protein